MRKMSYGMIGYVMTNPSILQAIIAIPSYLCPS